MSRLIKSHLALNKDYDAKMLPLKKISSANHIDEENSRMEDAEAALFLVKEETKRMKEEASRVMEEAYLHISAEKEEWLSQREILVSQAREEGYAAGYDQGKKQAIEDYEDKLQEINSLAELSQVHYLKRIEEAEDTILALGLKTARKILAHQLSEEPKLFLSLVANALKEVRESEKIKVYVSLHDYELVSSSVSELKSSLMSDAELFVYLDDSISPGGCIVESPYGKIDAGIDTQLNELKIQLFQLLKEK
ncbi:flagellar assembly protein FliH [Metabacillus lacus]|uniref:flagellar assembly protein FliH n=1 Tax=Metabacillus lacus TaxID=1983721 RepID=UPI001478732E|nr:flagellar assembly protein FliH [Metabacillus lacus]